MSNFLRGLASEKEQLNAALLRIKELEQEVIDEEKFSEESHELLKEAWDQRDEARAEVERLKAEFYGSWIHPDTHKKLEADNAKLRANIVAAMALRDELRHDVEVLTADNAKLREEIGLLQSEAKLDGLNVKRLRARLTTAEAAIAAFIASQVADNVWESDGSVEVALAAWREGKT